MAVNKGDVERELRHYSTINVYAEREGLWQLVAIQACPLAR